MAAVVKKIVMAARVEPCNEIAQDALELQLCGLEMIAACSVVVQSNCIDAMVHDSWV